jgi:hypothetical protein
LCPAAAADDVLRQSRDVELESTVITITHWHGGCIYPITKHEKGNVMDTSFDFQPVYPHHDLLIELCQVEMAIDGLSARADNERGALQPGLELRLQSLLEALNHLAV